MNKKETASSSESEAVSAQTNWANIYKEIKLFREKMGDDSVGQID